MTPEQMLKLIQKQLTAYNARDIEKFRECFHEEIQMTEIFTGAVTLSGLKTFTETYGNMFAASPNLHCELKSRIVLKECVVDEEFVTGSSRFPNGLHATAVYGFRDGKIDRVTFAK